MLTTKTKIAFAALAYRAVAAVRAAAGKGHHAVVRRQGVRWSLDLSEGIDFSIYLLGAFEHSTVATLRKLVRQGDTVLDIGANMGAHTLGMARSVGPTGKVYAFEPADFAVEKLRRNLALNPELRDRTQVRQVLLGASASEKAQPEIYASWPLEDTGKVHPKHRGRLVTTANAQSDTLDCFVEREKIERLDLIKLDVDGHELPVLQGGRATLAKFRPVLVMEMSPYVHEEERQSFTAFVNLLREAGYALQDTANWKALPLDAKALGSLIPDGASINVIARCENKRA